jgi:hypothetical protein
MEQGGTNPEPAPATEPPASTPGAEVDVGTIDILTPGGNSTESENAGAGGLEFP